MVTDDVCSELVSCALKLKVVDLSQFISIALIGNNLC